jgi:6-phosphogluconolactonase
MEQIITNKTRSFLDKTAVEIIENSIHDHLKTKKIVVFGICGGRSVTGIFGLLGSSEKILWEKIHIFMVDERIVPITDDESNYNLAKIYFINKLLQDNLIPESNLHPFVPGIIPEDTDIKKYENELKQYQDYYDISLLSSGEDGHVASLYPDHHSIMDDSEFYMKMKDSPKPPNERMGASRKLLGRSAASILLFYGESKRDAYIAFNNTKIDYTSCPAKITKNVKDSFVLTDLDI